MKPPQKHVSSRNGVVLFDRLNGLDIMLLIDWLTNYWHFEITFKVSYYSFEGVFCISLPLIFQNNKVNIDHFTKNAEDAILQLLPQYIFSGP